MRAHRGLLPVIARQLCGRGAGATPSWTQAIMRSVAPALRSPVRSGQRHRVRRGRSAHCSCSPVMSGGHSNRVQPPQPASMPRDFPRRTGCGPTPTLARTPRLTCARTAAAPASPRDDQEAMRPKKTILCVDDNEQALSARKFMLETRGYRVVSASHSEQAIEVFQECAIDLVLSDLIMPRMDGNELIRRLKEHSPDVPMVLISGCVKAFDRANHADAFLPKGACSPLEILERIRSLMARKRGPKGPGAHVVRNDFRPESATSPVPASAERLVAQSPPGPLRPEPPRSVSFRSEPFPPETFRAETFRQNVYPGARMTGPAQS